jgi:hypothetical protein
MITVLKWLGRNKTIAVLLAILTYFSIVTFHDEITQIAIKLRNTFGRDHYNAFLGYFFLGILVMFISYLVWRISKSKTKKLDSLLALSMVVLMLLSFRYLMTYNIEAIHFVEYAMVAIILLPVLRSYGETVFWVTILGLIDELFQYFFLVPEFEYLDFNDNILNLLGAGSGVIFVHMLGREAVDIRKYPWYKSPAIITATVLLAVFLMVYISGKMTFNPTGLEDGANWFSLNRKAIPDEFWKEAYAGRSFHIMRPVEGIAVMYMVFAGFFILDGFLLKQKSQS